MPCFGVGNPRLSRQRLDPRRVAWINDRLIAVANRNRTWVRMLDPSGQVCTPDGHPAGTTGSGQALRTDGIHFVPATADWFWRHWLAGQVAAAFDRAP